MSAFRWCWRWRKPACGSTSTISTRKASKRCKAGRLPFIEHGAENVLSQALINRRLVFTHSSDRISGDGPVIITIGTPIDEFLNPVRKVVQDCVDALLPSLADGQLVVLRSTVFPGTTDWLASYLHAKGRSLKVAFCPERVVQGNGLKELRDMPQIVSGTTPEAEREAAALFERIAPEVVVVSPIEAEFAKLFSNAYRYIEFAATNEFYLVAKSAGVDYQRVLKAMKHNYPRLKGMPRPGFAAGPCLVKDTMQLSAFARNQFGLGHAALLINEGLVLHVVDDIKRRYDLANITRRPARHGVQGGKRRYPRFAQLQVQEGAERAGARGADHRPVRDHGPRPPAARRSDCRERSPDPVRAARRLPGRRLQGPAGVRRLGPSARRQRHPMNSDAPPRLDIIIPVYNEGANILPTLQSILRTVKTPPRVLICYDREDDDTLPAINDNRAALGPLAISLVRNRGRGAHGAVLSGFAASKAPFAIVLPADDDYNAGILDAMVARAEAGCDIVCASRFIPGGSMTGCPWLKAALVRAGNFSLFHLARLPTRDASNGFRLFSRRVMDDIVVESDRGFCYSIELLVKCHRLGWRIGEVPARWFERAHGTSRFQVIRWLPAYLRWYLYAFATTYLRRPARTVRVKAPSHPA